MYKVLKAHEASERARVSQTQFTSGLFWARKELFARFGIKSKAGLVIFAYRWGIVKVITEVKSERD